MNINLHIERLILNDVGIESHQKKELKAAVESELERRLITQGLGSTIHLHIWHQSVRGGPISFQDAPKLDHLGKIIGHAIYAGIK